MIAEIYVTPVVFDQTEFNPTRGVIIKFKYTPEIPLGSTKEDEEAMIERLAESLKEEFKSKLLKNDVTELNMEQINSLKSVFVKK